MKKSLLFSAAAFMVAGSLSLSAEQVWKSETVFNYGVKAGVANPVPGLDGGWSDASHPAISTPNGVRYFTCSRFGAGHDGKFYTTDHVKNAIIAIDGNGVETYISLEDFTTIGEKWNGTAINFDDAGNCIFNYNFTNKDRSASEWAVYNPATQTLTNVNLDPASTHGRVDQIGKLVGNAVSAEGAIGYVTHQNNGTVTMLKFTGDGTKVTKVEATDCPTPLAGLSAEAGNACLSVAVPKYSTVAEIEKENAPYNYYVVLGANSNGNTSGLFSNGEGVVGQFNGTQWAPIYKYGNRGVNAIATFELQGKRYIVRNYVTPEFAEANPLYTVWKNVQNFGIFEAETAECVASWMGSDFANGFGMGNINAEVIDDNTVNIYAWVATGSAEPESGTVPGAYCSLVKFTVTEGEVSGGIQGKGTEADPYLIATKEDLCAAHKLIPQDVVGNMVYFKQTADIDMAGVDKEFEALNGWGGLYCGKFSYDGDYHVIKNFGPQYHNDETDGVGGYYRQALFGILSGEVKNLGLVDCNILGDKFGVGALGAYAGHNAAEANALVDNVFVTGKVESLAKYCGGMFGTIGTNATVKNSYAVVDVTGQYAGGVVGRLRNNLTLENGYVQATVNGTANAGIIAGSDKTGLKVVATNFVAIGAGDALSAGNTVEESGYYEKVDAADEDIISTIQNFEAFTEGKMLNGMPTLNWVATPVEQDGTAEHPYLIATKEDLCAAHKLIPQDVVGNMVYFKQTADIDMAGVDHEFEALNGWGGQYCGKFSYDGDYHVIKNFGPKYHNDETDGVGGYYRQALFGILSGEVKNLGLVDCNILGDKFGVGALGAYAGHNAAEANALVDNVFVTGKVESLAKYCGGMFGTIGTNATVKNSYAVVDVTGQYAGGVVGRLRNNLTLENGYVQATVNGTANAGIIAGSDKTGLKVVATNFIAIGAGDALSAGNTVEESGYYEKVDAADEDVIGVIQEFAPFADGKMMNGMPTLNWLTEDQMSGVDNVAVDENNENAPVEYFNLQGVRVQNPANGLYIKRQGNKVTKVVIR